MDIFEGAQKAMAMTDRVWARHANPWSGYTRLISGTLIFFAAWSVYWIGWYAAGPIGLALLWVWINPRLFPPPKTTVSWATKGVLGERVFLNRKTIPVPVGHRRVGWITTLISLAFLVLTVYGFIERQFWTAFTAWHAAMLAKIWFIDRMVWLWETMKTEHPVYQAWDRADWTAALTGPSEKKKPANRQP